MAKKIGLSAIQRNTKERDGLEMLTSKNLLGTLMETRPLNTVLLLL